MGAYQPLFDICVEHEYFAFRGNAGVEIEAGAPAQQLILQFRLLSRAAPGSLAVLIDAARFADLHRHVLDAGGVLRLPFYVYATDPHFAAYSLPPARTSDVLFLDSSNAAINASGRQMLHQAEFVSEMAYAPYETAKTNLPAGLSRARRQPVAIIDMVLGLDASSLCNPALETPCRSFCLRVGAGHTYWKYLLFGDLAERHTKVVDLDGELVFRRVQDAEFAGQRRAAVFLSDRAIPLRAVPAQRVQLKEQASFGEKILMKRMPNARIGTSQRELVDGEEVLVSEIFIH